MKKKQIFAVAATVTMSLTLVGCTLSTPFQIMDGDGMVYEDPTANQTPDPVKPVGGNNGGESGNTDNPEVTNPENTVDNDALIDAFINGEAKAKFDHIISKEENAYYSLDEMVAARSDYFINDYFGGGLEEEEKAEYTCDSTVYYAYIDCGADGVKDLGIRIDFEIGLGDDYYQYPTDSFILMVVDGELKCITVTESYYRSFGDFNEYGYITEGGSGGAALYVDSARFVDAKGNIVFNYYCDYYMSYNEPSIHLYSVPEYMRGDCPAEEHDAEGNFNTAVYNFEDYPEYPTNLTWDPDTGKYDAESQKRYDQYEKDYDEWLSKNFFVFEQVNGEDFEIPDYVQEFLDKYDIEYYKNEAGDKMKEHRKAIGLTDEIINGGYPNWVCISGGEESSVSTDLEALYVGEYLDDLNDPNLEIAKGSDGKYIVQIGIYRLCFLDDGVGELYDDRMEFGISDDNGGHMEGNIVVDEDGTATVTFTDSDWNYIENGATYTYKKSSDTPNIFVYEFDFED